MSERPKPDREIINQLERVLRIVKWCDNVGYRPPDNVSELQEWLADYIENLNDQCAN